MDRNIRSRISIATCCPKWKQIAGEFHVAIELDQFCQAKNMDSPIVERITPVIRRDLEEFPGAVFHAPFNELFPAAIDPKARKLAMDRYLQAAELARSFGIRKMVVHSGWIPHVYFKEWHIPRSAEFWAGFMEHQPEDFHLSIENVLDDEPEMMAEIVRRMNDPRVGICYDVGHANIVSREGQDRWMEVLAPYLNHLHIHNNGGKRDEHKGLTEGTLDIERLLDHVIENCSEETTVTCEILAGKESFTWLEEKGYLG